MPTRTEWVTPEVFITHNVLELWREGRFDEIREEWPEAPKEMFPK